MHVFTQFSLIGMYVLESKQEQGYGSSILRGMKDIVNEMGYNVVYASCWHSNQNSKKSMESAGAYSKTRLIRFYF